MDDRHVLTIMPDYGSGPFLWYGRFGIDLGLGGNCCSYRHACGLHPLSDDLLEAFSAWVLVFDRAPHRDNNCTDDVLLDWPSFHALGLALAVRLKREVGPAFRVVYEKPMEDPQCRGEERREILNDGAVVPLPSHATLQRLSFRRLIRTIVSGGQTGADRAALDWALANDTAHGGWCPLERRAEDGPIDARYRLREAPSKSYGARTRLNVRDSDGTLVVSIGVLDGGTLDTCRIAEQLGKPLLIVPLDDGVNDRVVAKVLAWLRERPVTTLNVGGPRENRRPGSYRLTWALLDAVAQTSVIEERERSEQMEARVAAVLAGRGPS